MPITDVIGDTRIPVKLWTPLSGVEFGAVQQLHNVANLPCSWKHIAVMPDVHFGYGATVGTVMVTEDAIVPSAVGVDIGCGLMAVKTPLDPDAVFAKRGEILHSIGRSVPTGFHENRDVSDEVSVWKCEDGIPGWAAIHDLSCPDTHELKLLTKAQLQMGSLGGGNHFIEVCLDEERKVWVMLHSGSRHIGLRIANYHMKVARQLMDRYYIKLTDPYLAYIPRGEDEFDDYMKDLFWAQQYASANRVEMMRKVLKDLAYAVNEGKEFERLFEVNCHHNYADWEHHFGRDVIVVRKGATRAREGDYGIIPGSMGAKSYIVRGKGNPESFCSSSHGAGRRMGRKEAKRQFTVEDLKRMTEGVECRKDKDVIDEIPAAYKDVDIVIAQQGDLVEPIAKLKQIICVKGGGNPDRD